MLEFRLGSLLLKLVVLLALGLGGYEYFSRLETLKAEIAEKRNLAQATMEAIEIRKAQWQELESAKKQIEELLAREAAALQQRDTIDKTERRLTGQIKFLAASMLSAVEKVRTAAVGTTLKELRLPGRSALLNAKIMKIEDNSITFLHEDGVANLKLQMDELPADLVAKYDMGSHSLAKRLQRLEKEIGDNGTR